MRVVLLLCCCFVIAKHVLLHKPMHEFSTNDSSVAELTAAWRQPPALTDPFIGSDKWQFDYLGVERALRDSDISPNGDLLINASTADTLQRAAAKLPEALGFEDFQRLLLLIRKSYPGKHGVQLASLVESYHYYKLEQGAYRDIAKNAKDQDTMALLIASITHQKQSQIRHFGAQVATKLFNRQNASIDYLLTRRLINSSSKLSDAQKKLRLSKLQSAYKKALSTQYND